MIWALLAILLMLIDQRTTYLRQVESTLSFTIVPIQYIVSSPADFFNWVKTSLKTQNQLLEDNARLRAQELLLQMKLSRVVALESENSQLRALLKASPHVGGKFMAAELISVDSDPYVQQVILNRGKNDNIYVGQPVVDAYGVMGQVIKVFPSTSRVLLVTDLQNAVPVQNSRNGIRAIAAGMGYTGSLQLINVPDTTDVEVGDVFVTSGLEGRYPPGYPVGVVQKVSRDPQYQFATIILKPSAHIDRARQTLVVWPDQIVNAPASDTNKATSNTENSEKTATVSGAIKKPDGTPIKNKKKVENSAAANESSPRSEN
jgi:rod shape-determining protein MreC